MSSTDFRLGEFIVQPGTNRLIRGELRVELEPKSMAVLMALAAQPGDVISSDTLIHEIWHDRPMGDNPVYKSVAKLRQALDDEAGEPRYIETIARMGYRLLMQPQPLAAPRRSPWSRWQPAAIGLGIGIAFLAIVGGYATYMNGTGPEAISSARALQPQIYFHGLESDSANVTAVNAMILDRLHGLPGLSVSERPLDAPLATLRLSGSAKTEGDQLRVRMRLDGERGSDLWTSELVLPIVESYRVADQVAAAVQEAASLARRDDQLAKLPFPILQSYLQARTELRERRLGFRQRLKDASAEVVRAAPDFAPGQAIRAEACLFGIADGSDTGAQASLQCARDGVARAMTLDSELAETHAAAGLLALNEGYQCYEDCSMRRWPEIAQQSLERAVRLDPTLFEARIWLGNTYTDRGDLARASEQREAALALDPLSPIANLYMNELLLARGETELVRERLSRLARAPSMPFYIYEQLAEVAIATHRFDEARSWARRVATDTEVRRSLMDSAALLARSGDAGEARKRYAKVSWIPPSYDDTELHDAVSLHQLLGGPAAVRDFIDGQLEHALKEATPTDGENRDLRMVIGWSLAMADQPQRARPWLESIYGKSGAPGLDISDIPSEIEGLETLAWVSERSGNPARARELAQGALELLSMRATAGLDQDASYALSRALALLLNGQRDLALAGLARAVDLGWAEPAFIRADPRWASLRDDPAAKLLLDRADEQAAPVQFATASVN